MTSEEFFKNNIPHIYKQYIDYQDTDTGGVVYHGNYINFAERARAKLFRDIFGQEELNRYLWVVTELEVKFIFPAKLGDLITVITGVKEIKNCSLSLSQDVFVKDKLIVKLLIKIASLNHKFKIVKFANEFKVKLINYMENITNE